MNGVMQNKNITRRMRLRGDDTFGLSVGAGEVAIGVIRVERRSGSAGYPI
jgi:hypothetical protein